MSLYLLFALEHYSRQSAWLTLPILLPFGWLWCTQFIQLMLMSEHDFPGRQDKFIWGAAFVLLFIFAPFAFWGWKTAHLAELDRLHHPKREGNGLDSSKSRNPRMTSTLETNAPRDA